LNVVACGDYEYDPSPLTYGGYYRIYLKPGENAANYTAYRSDDPTIVMVRFLAPIEGHDGFFYRLIPADPDHPDEPTLTFIVKETATGRTQSVTINPSDPMCVLSNPS